MASLDDLKLSYRLYMRAYAYRQVPWRPGARLGKPLHETRVALITTAAFHLPDQPPFDERIRGGDWSYREIPLDADLPTLGIAHKSDAFDHRGIEHDRNLALPLHRLLELHAEGAIGAPAEIHYSFMGSVTAPGRLITESGPAVAALLKQREVDAVLLTPV